MSRLKEPEKCVDGVVLVGHADIVEGAWWQVHVASVTSNTLCRLAGITLKTCQKPPVNHFVARKLLPSNTDGDYTDFPL